MDKVLHFLGSLTEMHQGPPSSAHREPGKLRERPESSHSLFSWEGDQPTPTRLPSAGGGPTGNHGHPPPLPPTALP